MSLSRYPSYKDSGVAWLGEIPESWSLKPLWTLFKRVKFTDFIDEELLSVYRDYGVIPKSSRSDNNNKPSEDLSPYQLVKIGDLVINKMKAWQGSVAISQYRGIVSPAYFVYESLNQEDLKYLHYLMRSPRYITGYLTLSKGIRVNQWDLEPQYHSRMKVILPPLSEQTLIAQFLDRETAKIDDLIEEQEKLITLLDEKRQSMISHAVTKGLNPDAPMKDSGVEWLGELPEHWSIVRAKFVSSIFVPQRNKPTLNLEGDGVSWATMEDIKGKTLNETNLWVSELAQLESGSKVLYPPAIISSCVGNFGSACIINTPVIINQQLQAYVPNQKIKIEFLQYFILISKSYYEIVGTAATLVYVNRQGFENLIVFMPSLDEQNTIIDYLDQKIAQFDTLKAEAQRGIDLLKERRSTLISAAVTGKIDVRGLVNTEAA